LPGGPGICRRVGERGEEPRPMVVGFGKEDQKEELLEKARNLRMTGFSAVGVSPDLTEEQRRDEGDLAKEAERRNRERTEEDRSKNLVWMLVGQKGERRLIKTVDRGHRSGGNRQALERRTLAPGA